VELQRAHGILRPGQRVIDLGCWPGGWLQQAARVVGAKGRVVGVDLKPLDPPLEEPNVIALVADIEDPELPGKILDQLDGSADLLLSDAAPKLTGVREVDRAAEERLLVAIEWLLPCLLGEGGDLLAKLLECPETQEFKRRMRDQFRAVKTVRVRATRKGSSEHYLLARGFRVEKSIG
jgi:23S rRNA (uridine2552-2'-O)-methyltransferase